MQPRASSVIDIHSSARTEGASAATGQRCVFKKSVTGLVSPSTSVLAGAASLLLLSSSVMAQQVIANGIVVTVPGGSFTTTTNFTPAFLAENGGSIVATAPVTLLTQGGTSFGVQALTGSTVTLNGGSVTTTGPSGSDVLLSNASTITVTGVDLATTSGGANGAQATNGGSLFIHGGTINSNTGGGTASILASGVGSQATADQGLQITTSAVGAWAIAGGSISLDTVSIANSGNLPFVSGIRADGATSSVTANNVSINLTSNFADGGALAEAGGKITIQNSAITTSGVQGFGLHASQSDASTSPPTLARIDATNVTITTTGASGIGVVASNGALVNLNTVNVSTSGADAYGLFVEGFLASGTTPIQTQITGTGVTVNATGNTGYGAVVVASGVLDLTDSSLSATGANAGGVFVSDTGSAAMLNRSTVTSAQLDAGVVSESGHLLATNSVLSGNNNGVSSSGGTAADPNVISVSGGSLTAVNGDAFHAQDTIAQIALTNGTAVTAGSGNLLNVISTDPATMVSNVTFNVQGITAAGNIIADAASIATVNLTQNTTITGIERNTFTTVDSSSTWIMNGNSDIHSLTLAGLVQYTSPTGDPNLLSSYKTLTTQNYIGQGGTIGLNTFLGSDSSPSDRLVINGGNASGNSLLRIANTIGPGALTVANGILVVDAINGGTTAPGAFALAGRVVAGPFEYTLFRSSVDASNPQAWYLRSTLDCSLAPNAAACPPNFRPETSIYAALPSTALLYGRNLLDTLHERVGEEEDIRGRRDLHQRAPATGAWGRIIGTHGKQDGDTSGIFGSGPQYDYDFVSVQAGQDLFRYERGDGSRDHAGLYFAYGNANSTVTHFNGQTGTNTFNAYTLGGYWTHFGATGWYVDSVLQGTRYDTTSTANAGLPALRTHADGVAVSFEGGKPFRFERGWFIEPQAQLIYQAIDFAGASDTRAQINFTNVDSLVGRLGARFGRTWSLDDHPGGRLMTAWIRPNIWHEFYGDPITQFSSANGPVPFRATLGGTWGEINIGVSGQLDRNTTLFANASYSQRFDGGGFAFDGKAGVRANW